MLSQKKRKKFKQYVILKLYQFHFDAMWQMDSCFAFLRLCLFVWRGNKAWTNVVISCGYASTHKHTKSRPCRPLKMEGSLRQSVAKAKIVGKVLSYWALIVDVMKFNVTQWSSDGCRVCPLSTLTLSGQTENISQDEIVPLSNGFVCFVYIYVCIYVEKFEYLGRR